jgi:hypothetical protein
MRRLPDVTLCAIDCLYPKLAGRALERSASRCEFQDTVLFADVAVEGSFRTELIAPIGSREAYSRFVLEELAARIRTPFVLIVQWDGWAVDADAWRPEFLNYDYIGAVWPWHTDGMMVGNGGFSLRSARLLSSTANEAFQRIDGLNEDELICRVQRPSLEKNFGIKFAPPALADLFSYERRLPDVPTFGFHGLFNMWRHVEDAQMLNILMGLEHRTLCTREGVELLLQYFRLRKFRPATVLFSQMRRSMTEAELRDLAHRSIGNAATADACLRACEHWRRLGSVS